MKTTDNKLTVDELDELCRLYMDCKLSVMEEKELEYILSRTSISTPLIDDVKAVMSVHLLPKTTETTGKTRYLNWKLVSGIAASIALIFSVSYLFYTSHPSNLSDVDYEVSVVAYNHGKRLSESQAMAAADIAMSKADSLMMLASLTEREYMLRTDDLIRKADNN